MLEFCDRPPLDAEKIRGIIARAANAQVGGAPFPKWKDWSEDQRAILRAAALRAAEYGYELKGRTRWGYLDLISTPK